MSHLEQTVDARFAGGPLTVTTTTLPHDDTLNAVRVAGPGFDILLFDHEAAALAAALRLAIASLEGHGRARGGERVMGSTARHTEKGPGVEPGPATRHPTKGNRS